VSSGANAIAFGANSSAIFANSAAIGAGAATTRANQMALGTGTNTYTMAGITSAASTGAQSGPLEFVTSDSAGNLAAVNLGPTFSNLSSDIGDLRSESRGGTALAMAAAQIRYDDRGGKLSIGVGGAGFIDEGGGALGIGYTTPDSRMRVNASGGVSSQGDFGGGAGLGFTVN
jgi:trimeric autotransporter adhesin